MAKKTQQKNRVELVQMLYQYFLLNISQQELLKIIHESSDFNISNYQEKILKNVDEWIDEVIEKVSMSLTNNWTWMSLTVVNKAIFTVAYLEYKLYRLPKPIIINEYVNIGKMFDDLNEIGFINSILDKIIK